MQWTGEQAMQDTPKNNGLRQPVSLQLNAELIALAEAAGVDVTVEIESALRRAIASQSRRWAWVEENRSAIDENNAELERNGQWYEPTWLAQ
jgi:post-segregation antitoxin (ccd killing protein)